MSAGLQLAVGGHVLQQGPLLSISLFEELMIPKYKKETDPLADHRVLPELTFENYVYYLKAKSRIIGREGGTNRRTVKTYSIL